MAKKLRVWVVKGGISYRMPSRTRLPLALGALLDGQLIRAWGWEGDRFVVHVR